MPNRTLAANIDMEMSTKIKLNLPTMTLVEKTQSPGLKQKEDVHKDQTKAAHRDAAGKTQPPELNKHCCDDVHKVETKVAHHGLGGRTQSPGLSQQEDVHKEEAKTARHDAGEKTQPPELKKHCCDGVHKRERN